ncbi:MAG: exosortase N [Bacteroidales bacterium]|jgi:exosortase N|nr:exosortase N [Bacteroidales bacterium]
MVALLKQFNLWSAGKIIFVLSVFSCILLVILFFREYLSAQLFNLALGVIVIPFAIKINSRKKGSFRFAIVAVSFMLLSFYVPVHTFIYFALISVLLFLVESRFGRINFLTVVVAVLVMPITSYLLNTFSFPVRIWLTSVCGYLFGLAGVPVVIAGNTIVFDGVDFTVDPACMGLSMLTTSFLVGVLLLGFYQKQCKKELPVWGVCLYLLIILLLNVFSNLIRMMVLVLFQVMPETIMHDIVGIICFSVQVILPAWIISRLMMMKLGKQSKEDNRIFRKNTGKLFYIPVQIACCLLLWMATLHVSDKKISGELQTMHVPGYETTRHSQGIFKLENNNSLVYVKRIRWFCDTEHNPMICWKGSGYTITQVQETVRGDFSIYTGILYNGQDVLYTAWWYTNGYSMTNSQLHWRWDMLKGAHPYSLVNVTVASKEELESGISEMIGLAHEVVAFRF